MSIIKYYKDAIGKIGKGKSNKLDIHGDCPECGNSVIEFKGNYICINNIINLCSYKRPTEFMGEKIEYSEIVRFEKYKAMLELGFLDSENIADEPIKIIEKQKIKREVSLDAYVDSKEKKRASHVKKNKVHDYCPICGKKVVIGKASYGCMGNLDKTCNFTVPFEFECMPIEESDLETLLRGSTLTLYRFDNPNDEIDVKLDKNGNLELAPF